MSAHLFYVGPVIAFQVFLYLESFTNDHSFALLWLLLSDHLDRWLRRIGRAENSSSENNGAIRIFSDVNQQWIKQYGADKGRSSLTLYSMDSDGVIQQLIREMDPSQTVRLVSEITQSAAKV